MSTSPTFVRSADGTAMVGLLKGREPHYCKWCSDNFLKVNVTKTKEMVTVVKEKSHSPRLIINPSNE